jgi:hypothetical protein
VQLAIDQQVGLASAGVLQKRGFVAYVASESTTIDAEKAGWMVRLLLLLFVLICIFDPADRVGGKVVAFVAVWPFTLLSLALKRNEPKLPGELLAYVIVFIAIPLLSIGWYYIIDGRQPFEGYSLLKGYLLILLSLVLVLNRVDIIPQLSAALTVLAVLVIAVFVFLQFDPEQFESLHDWGIHTGILSLDRRTYGENLQLIQVYFVTSSMLAVSIAYYFDRAMSVPGRWTKLGYFVLVSINILGMLLAGTRNNIIVSLLLPLLLWPLYTKRVALNTFFSLLALAILAIPFSLQLQTLFDPEETANSIKLALVHDYMDLFSDPVTLLFGQGLGAYRYWSASNVYFYISELTYLEMIRNFGLFGAIAMMALLLFPVAYAFFNTASRRERALAMAYFLYLLMAVSNPLLFSSSGMLILVALIANIALDRIRDEKLRGPP